MEIPEKYCILDIETYTPTGKPDPEKDELRYIGFRVLGKNGYFHYTKKEEIQKAISYFDYAVGHNIKGYDIPVLERHGHNFRNVTIIDTLEIAIKRCKTMMYIDLNRGQRSLGALCEIFNLTHSKGAYDYSKLKDTSLMGEDLEELVGYLYGDLEATDDLFRYFYEFFFALKDFHSRKDQRRMSWLTCSPGTTVYKALCNEAGLEEVYGDKEEIVDADSYAGGYVSMPFLEYAGVGEIGKGEITA